MKEEEVTKALLSWLTLNNWKVISFDYPQSGTGVLLHPNYNQSEKNKGSIIPDIIAIRNNIAVFFENKDRFVYSDYQKVNNLIKDNIYTASIDTLLHEYSIDIFAFGIGLPTVKYNKKAEETKDLVNFILGVNENLTIRILFDAYKIFIPQ